MTGRAGIPKKNRRSKNLLHKMSADFNRGTLYQFARCLTEATAGHNVPSLVFCSMPQCMYLAAPLCPSLTSSSTGKSQLNKNVWLRFVSRNPSNSLGDLTTGTRYSGSIESSFASCRERKKNSFIPVFIGYRTFPSCPNVFKYGFNRLRTSKNTLGAR